MTISIAGLEGDGIGREVYPFGRRAVLAANDLSGTKAFAITDLPYNAEYYLTNGRAWPEGTPEELQRSVDAIFLIALGDPRVPRGGMAHAEKIIIETARRQFNTNLNMRPIEVIHPDLVPKFPQGPFHFKLFDTSEGPRASEVQKTDASGKWVEVTEIQDLHFFGNLLREAAIHALECGDPRVLIAHKGNILNHTHRLWSEEVEACRKEIPGVKFEEALMDSFCERLVRKPNTVPKTIVTDKAFSSILQRAVQGLSSGSRGHVPNDLKLVIARENVEGMYVQRGEVLVARENKIGSQIGIHSEHFVKEVLREGAAIATQKNFNHVTVLHLGDVYPATTEFWGLCAKEVICGSNLRLSFLHAGDFISQAISNPANLSHQVFVADNLIGDICGDAAAALVGGMGIPATNSFNTDGTTAKRFFEPLHGSAPDIAGQGKANPTATFLTAAEILESYGHPVLALALKRAIFDTIESGVRTPDMPNGRASTSQFGEEVLKKFIAAC